MDEAELIGLQDISRDIDNQENPLTDTEVKIVAISVLAGMLLSLAGSVYIQTHYELPATGVVDCYSGAAFGIGTYLGYKIGIEIVESKRILFHQLRTLREYTTGFWNKM